MPRGSRGVLAGAALLSVVIFGAGLWAARGGASTVTWTPAVKVSSTAQRTGSVKLVRAVYKIEVDGMAREWVQLTPSGGVTGSRPVIVVLSGVNVPYQPGDKGRESPPATVEVARLRAVNGATGAATVVTDGTLRLSTWHGQDGTRVEFAVYGTGGHSFPQPRRIPPREPL